MNNKYLKSGSIGKTSSFFRKANGTLRPFCLLDFSCVATQVEKTKKKSFGNSLTQNSTI